MNDTSPRMVARMRDMILQKLPEERLRLGCSMFDFSKKLVTMGILREHPDASPTLVRKELFQRFYGDDFDARQQEKIVSHLVQNSSE